MTDESGNVTERYAYDAYGVPTILDAAGVERATSAENSRRFMYTGRECDKDLSLAVAQDWWTSASNTQPNFL